jgi:hypothetical protein
MSHVARRASWARLSSTMTTAPFTETAEMWQEGYSNAACMRALILLRPEALSNRRNVVAALIVFAGIASAAVTVAFAIGLFFDADRATRDS